MRARKEKNSSGQSGLDRVSVCVHCKTVIAHNQERILDQPWSGCSHLYVVEYLRVSEPELLIKRVEKQWAQLMQAGRWQEIEELPEQERAAAVSLQLRHELTLILREAGLLAPSAGGERTDAPE